MKILTVFIILLTSAPSPALAQALETPVEDGANAVGDLSTLYEVLSGLPDQIMAVLLAYLCFKTFLDMVK